jgi:hypothetical protein
VVNAAKERSVLERKQADYTIIALIVYVYPQLITSDVEVDRQVADKARRRLKHMLCQSTARRKCLIKEHA